MKFGHLRKAVAWLLVLSLSCSVVLAAPEDAVACGEFQHGNNYPGNDIKSIPNSPDASSCEGKCKETEGCKGFTWNKSSLYCWLKHAIDMVEPHPDGVSMVLCTDKDCDQKQNHIDYPGNDIKGIPNSPNPHWCKAKCEETLGCRGFTWNKKNHYCWLKHAMKNPRKHPDGVSMILCYPLLCDHKQKNIDYPGNDIKGIPNSPDAHWCMDKCQETLGCRGFTWNRKNHYCWLKHTMKGRTKHADGVSGVMCHPLLCDHKQDHIDYPGNDMKRFADSPDAHWCMDKCKNTVGCKGYTWSEKSKYCHLKRAMKGRKHSPHSVSGVLCDPLMCDEMQFGYDYPHNDIKHIPDAPNPHRCMEKCKETLNCKGFTWNKQNKYCYLKHTVDERYPAKNGVSSVLCHPLLCGQLQHGIDYPGNDLKGVKDVQRPKRCELLCKRNDHCKGFTWNRKNHYCWLKHTMKGRKYHPDGVSEVLCH